MAIFNLKDRHSLVCIIYFRKKQIRMNKVEQATNNEQVLKCFEAMQALRPHLKKEEFVGLINKMKSEGYLLAYVNDNDKVVAVTGYRYLHHLYCGKLIYVDDLSTLQEYRKKGYAKLLMDFILHEAKKNNCKHIDLDSACGPHRYDAHRFYLRYGFNITSHHFAMETGGD